MAKRPAHETPWPDPSKNQQVVADRQTYAEYSHDAYADCNAVAMNVVDLTISDGEASSPEVWC